MSDLMKSMCDFARYSNSKNGVVNMVALARSESGIPIAVDELDRDPWLLNVANGTLDLRSGKLLPHDQRQFLTKLAPVEFDPAATCKRWTEFLDHIFAGDDDLIGYLQRLVGYCLTGDVSEHLLPFFYGGGANGKSTFVEVALRLLGADYAMKAPPDLLLAKRGEAHPTERADLHGKRLVACIETEEGRRLAESLVKEMTGGDRIRARRLYQDFFEFAPSHKIWLAGNYKPTITGADYGIWRRVKLIPFNVTIPEAEQDKRLISKLAKELPGILKWAITGCLDWRENGMQEPEIVRAATREYQAESDEVGEFIEQHCQVGTSLEDRAADLFEVYQRNGGELTQHAFGSSLRRRGFESIRITKGRHKGTKAWKGIRLIAT